MAKFKRKWAKHRDRKNQIIAANDDGPTPEMRARARYIDGHGMMLQVPVWVDWPKEQVDSINQIAEAYRMIVSGLMPKLMKFGKEIRGSEPAWLNRRQEIIAMRYFAWRKKMIENGMKNDISWIVHSCYDANLPIRNIEKFQNSIFFHMVVSRSIH